MSGSDPAYMARYRAANPDYVAENNRQRRCRSKALARLAEAFPVEYHALLKDEIRKDRAKEEGW